MSAAPITESMVAVAAICVKAPASTQGQNVGGGCGRPLAERDSHAGEKEQREGKAEQEAHVRGADRAERRGQLALHGVARGLGRRGDQREDGPEHCVGLTAHAHAAADLISAASGNSLTLPCSLSIRRNRSK